MMRSFFLVLIYWLFTVHGFGQQAHIEKKNVSDTVLNEQRALIIPSDSFDAVKVMLKLFPGKLYSLKDGDQTDTFISWECKKCKPASYRDANDELNGESSQQFPYKTGVATRLIKVINYKDSKGNPYKILALNQSEYNQYNNYEERENRYRGGLLGLAKFVKTEGSWQMRSFQPAIAAFGSYESCDAPDLLAIGEDQYALTVFHELSEVGGWGGPSPPASLFVIVGIDGRYRPLLEMDKVGGRIVDPSSYEDVWAWESSIEVDNNSKKQYFRDIIVTTKGSYQKGIGKKAEIFGNEPGEVVSFTKNKEAFDFVIEKHYTFDGKHYTIKGKPVAAVTNAR